MSPIGAADPFLQRAVELVENVTVAAVAIHRLGTSRRVVTLPKKNTSPPTR
jgi:hypothetical protein